MSITEPTGWSADCDQCTEKWHPEERVGGVDDCVDYLRECGWIVLGWSTFCSLECLLICRAERLNRQYVSTECRRHADYWHTPTKCCSRHGHHAASKGHWSCRKCRPSA